MFVIGHLRGRSGGEVFPVEGADGENRVAINQIGRSNVTQRENPSAYRTYDTDGVSPTLTNMAGGAESLTSECQSGDTVKQMCNVNPSGNGMNGAVYDACAVGPTLTTNKGEGNKIAVPVDCIDDTQGFDGVRVYQDEAPTLRSQRGGLKVALPVEVRDEE